MASEILASISSVIGIDPIYIVVLFVVFVLVAYKALQILRRAVYVAIASAVFPFFLRWGLGIPIQITAASVIYFVLFGVMLYLIYEASRIVYGILKLAWGVLKIVSAPFVWLAKALRGLAQRKKARAKAVPVHAPPSPAPKKRGRPSKKEKGGEEVELSQVWKMGEEEE